MIGAPKALVIACFAVLSSTMEASTLQGLSHFLHRQPSAPREPLDVFDPSVLPCSERFVQLGIPCKPGRSLWAEKLPATPDPCPLPPNAKWCVVRLGKPFKMAVYDQFDNASKLICDTGTSGLQEADLDALGQAGNALDIGANAGFYSLALANRGWNVTAFELMAPPSALMDATLCKNPELAKKITLNKFGLGAKGEHCIMITDKLGDGQTKCGEDAVSFGRIGQAGYHQFGAFDMRRLDDVLSEKAVKQIDFVKLDVEGSECQVMAGGQSLLKNLRPRLIESAVLKNMEGCDATDYLTRFAKAAYTVSGSPVSAFDPSEVVSDSHALSTTVWLHRDEDD